MSFKSKKRISERNSYDMIVSMAYHANHYNDIHRHIKIISDIKAHFKQNGKDFKQAVLKCRDYSEHVPMYENLIGAQWHTHGVTVSKASHITGGYEPVISGDGTYNQSDYWANFELSKEDFENAISSGRFERFLSAVNAGISSIEAFLNHQYMVIYKLGSEEPELRETLEFKMKNWPEKLVGYRFDLSTRTWGAFVELKNLRDERFQHRKTISTGIAKSEHLNLLNMYKIAIPKLLFELHVHFGQRCPSAIIRCCFHPEIELVDENIA
jgi:hypothetical protein